MIYELSCKFKDFYPEMQKPFLTKLCQLSDKKYSNLNSAQKLTYQLKFGAFLLINQTKLCTIYIRKIVGKGYISRIF